VSTGGFDRQGSLIRQLQGALGGRSFTFGTATLTFTASTNSAGITVTHGLGKTPIGVLATGQMAPAFGNIVTPNPTAIGATTFGLSGEVKTAFTGSIPVFWMAVG
jgi:hypothetical protein